MSVSRRISFEPTSGVNSPTALANFVTFSVGSLPHANACFNVAWVSWAISNMAPRIIGTFATSGRRYRTYCASFGKFAWSPPVIFIYISPRRLSSRWGLGDFISLEVGDFPTARLHPFFETLPYRGSLQSHKQIPRLLHHLESRFWKTRYKRHLFFWLLQREEIGLAGRTF